MSAQRKEIRQAEHLLVELAHPPISSTKNLILRITPVRSFGIAKFVFSPESKTIPLHQEKARPTLENPKLDSEANNLNQR